MRKKQPKLVVKEPSLQAKTDDHPVIQVQQQNSSNSPTQPPNNQDKVKTVASQYSAHKIDDNSKSPATLVDVPDLEASLPRNDCFESAQQEAVAYARANQQRQKSRRKLEDAAGEESKKRSSDAAFENLRQLTESPLGSAEKEEDGDLDEQPTLPAKGLTNLVNSNPKSPSAKKLINDFSRELRDRPMMTFGGRRNSADQSGLTQTMAKFDIMKSSTGNMQSSLKRKASQSPTAQRGDFLSQQQSKHAAHQQQSNTQRFMITGSLFTPSHQAPPQMFPPHQQQQQSIKQRVPPPSLLKPQSQSSKNLLHHQSNQQHYQTNYTTQLTQPSTEAHAKQPAASAAGANSSGMLLNRRERCSSGQVSQKPLKSAATQKQTPPVNRIAVVSSRLTEQISSLLAEHNHHHTNKCTTNNNYSAQLSLQGCLARDQVYPYPQPQSLQQSVSLSKLKQWSQANANHYHQQAMDQKNTKKYSPPSCLQKAPQDIVLKTTTTNSKQAADESAVIETKTEQGSVIKFNTEEQMQAYNDIEQLNQFTSEHLRQRPSTKSRQLNKDNSVKMVGEGTTYLLVEHDTGSVIIEKMADNDTSMLNSSHSSNNHYLAHKKYFQESAVKKAQMKNASQNLRQSYKANSGKLSQILKSKNSPMSSSGMRRKQNNQKKQYSPYYHVGVGGQITPNSHQNYRNDGFQSCESFNDSPEQSARGGEEMTEITRVKARGNRGHHRPHNTMQEESSSTMIEKKKAISVQSMDRSEDQDSMIMIGQHLLKPVQSSAYMETDHVHAIPTLKVCIGGVPTLKQPSTQKTAQKTDIVDSFLKSGGSSKASNTQTQAEDGSNMTQMQTVTKESPNPFDLITVSDKLRQDSSSQQQQQQRRQQYIMTKHKSGSTRLYNNLQPQKPSFTQTILNNQSKSSSSKMRTTMMANKARSPPVKTMSQGLGFDSTNEVSHFKELGGKIQRSFMVKQSADRSQQSQSFANSSTVLYENGNSNFNSSIAANPFGNAAINGDDHYQQRESVGDKIRINQVINSRVSRNGLSSSITATRQNSFIQQSTTGGHGKISIFDEQTRKTNQFIIQKYEKNQDQQSTHVKQAATIKPARKPVTQRESNFLKAKQNRRENQQEIIVKTAKINSSQTERPEPGINKQSPMIVRNEEEPSEKDIAVMTNSVSIDSFSQAELGNTRGQHEESSQNPGMFGKLFTKLGGIFTGTNPTQPSSDKQTSNFDSMDEDSSNVSPSKQQNQNLLTPSKDTTIEGQISTEDIIDPSLMIKPMRRYGRICDCPKDPNYTMFCVKARNWYEMTSTGSQSLLVNTDSKYSKLKETYKNLAMMTPDENSLAQIERDLGRTFPRHHYFMKSIGGRGHEKLRRVLTAFANYERQVNYVQGMNFIVAQILLHCSETFAFWLFVALIEDCEMRDIYEPELSGLFKHSFMIELLIKANLPELHDRLTEYHIKANVYASEWIFGLFSSVIPCDHMGHFFDLFFKHKWIFFYQLILSLLAKHQDRIVYEEDFYHFMRQIKVQQYSGLDYAQALMQSANKSENRIDSSILSAHGNRELSRLYQRNQGLIREDLGAQFVEESFNSNSHSIHQNSASSASQALMEVGENEEESKSTTMFSAFKRFISAQVPWSDQSTAAADEQYRALQVTDVDFWPQIMERCTQEWSYLSQQPGIPRLLSSFNPKSMSFAEEVPDNPDELQAFLSI